MACVSYSYAERGVAWRPDLLDSGDLHESAALGDYRTAASNIEARFRY